MSEDMKKDTDIRTDYFPILNKLLFQAFEISPFDSLCSILRVGGMSDANWDPFEESRKAFDDFNWILDKSLSERSNETSRRIALLMYCQAIEMTAPHEIIANILRCILKEGYVIDPFEHLARRNKKKLFSYIPPSAKIKFQHIKESARKVGEQELIDKIDSFFDENIRNAFSHSDYIFSDEYFRFREGGLARQIHLEELDRKVQACFGFYGAFMSLHRRWLIELSKSKRFHKWPRYEVLEILSSKEEGVYGFNVHFSNGSKATYTRRQSGIRTINLHFDKNGHIGFMVGDLDALKPVWKIDGKPVDEWENLE